MLELKVLKENIFPRWKLLSILVMVFFTGILFQCYYERFGSKNLVFYVLNARPKSGVLESKIASNGPVTTTLRAKKLVILIHDSPPWFPFAMLKTSMPKCEFNNCEVTAEKRKFLSSSAVVFHIGVGKFAVSKPVNKDLVKSKNQVWVFMSREPPARYNVDVLKSPVWKNVLNWSMNYRFDADIPSSYGFMKKRLYRPVKNYSLIFENKDKMAVMFASHCNTQSKRDKFVELLRSKGLQVDVYGRCGNKKMYEKDMDAILERYKFYLSFENSFCKDYVTEKLYSRYNSDHILVVRGGANYSKVLPDGYFINSADFHNLSDLVKYLNKLGSDRNAYTKFLRRKDEYESTGPADGGWIPGFCELCRKLNNPDKYRKVYKDPYTYLNKDQCWSPHL